MTSFFIAELSKCTEGDEVEEVVEEAEVVEEVVEEEAKNEVEGDAGVVINLEFVSGFGVGIWLGPQLSARISSFRALLVKI